MTVAEQITAFNRALKFTRRLPPGIRVMNPFAENPNALEASSCFYRKYYHDELPRRFILGINPGRFGAGLTGVPFTDPKRLRDACGIDCYDGPPAHEPSSVFVYELIEAYGGVEAFYSRYYINSICPLGFVSVNKRGKEVNHNYYDSAELTAAVRDFAVACIKKQLGFNLRRDVAFCLGTGKNMAFLEKLNAEHGFFERIIPLEHPRYIIQYKTRQKDEYIRKYLDLLRVD